MSYDFEVGSLLSCPACTSMLIYLAGVCFFKVMPQLSLSPMKRIRIWKEAAKERIKRNVETKETFSLITHS